MLITTPPHTTTKTRLYLAEMKDTSKNSFTSAMTLSQMGLRNVPKRYVLPPTKRPTIDKNNNTITHCTTIPLPVVDLSSLGNPLRRSRIVEEVCGACKEFGAFQVINHGIPTSLMNDALGAAEEFFDLPNETKMRNASTEVEDPVRYGTSLNHINDKVKYWRDFIKLYSNPISTWIDLWPSDPPSYKKKMGNYAEAVHVLHKILMKLVFESLGLKLDYLQKDIAQGSQVLAVNCYPACPEPDLALGLPPHSDYGYITVLLQNQKGLDIMDGNKRWQSVPVIREALVVQLGDQIEVLSNGRYKSVVHQATLNSEKKRLSIASIHSLAIDKTVMPAPELVDEQHPLSYKESSFGDFLNFLSDHDILDGRYIDTLKNKP